MLILIHTRNERELRAEVSIHLRINDIQKSMANIGRALQQHRIGVMSGTYLGNKLAVVNMEIGSADTTGLNFNLERLSVVASVARSHVFIPRRRYRGL